MQNKEYMQWWREARFGMIIHWGLYSALGGEWNGNRQQNIGEWIMSEFRIPIAEYESLAARFNPVGFDADQWARLASRAGMKYLIITAKHHDGFAMYHSKCDTYNIVDATPFGRDPMAELAVACARHGVKLCFYYSQSLDWHEFGGGGFDADQLNFGMSWCNDWDFKHVQLSDYASYFENKVKPQVTELLTGYGPIGAIWFDCPFTISLEQSQELYDLVKRLQPDCIINNRLGNGLGDYGSFGDNQISGQVMEGDWETVATLNDTWGYKSFDNNWKSAEGVLELLTSSASMNVNYVLNIGPTGEGVFPPACVNVLDELGGWMDINAESIHGTLPSPFHANPENAAVTQKNDRLYLHLHDLPVMITLTGLRNSVERAYLLRQSDVDLVFRQDIVRCLLNIYPGDIEQTELCPVLVLEMDGLAVVDNIPTQQPDFSVYLPASLAQIHNADAVECRADQIIEPDGQPVSSVQSVAVCPMGAVVNWFSADISLSWDFMMHDIGVYEIMITSTGLHHSNPWAGGHKVKVLLDEICLHASMQQDEVVDDVSARYYTQARSIVGRVYIDTAGKHRLTLYGEDIQYNGGVGLAVMSVSLHRKNYAIL